MNQNKLRLAAGLAVLLLAPLGAALGQPMQCITQATKCDYDLLCTFQLELAEKTLIYETFLANGPGTKSAAGHSRQGIRYRGDLYQQALRDAQRAHPDYDDNDMAQEAYDQFAAAVSKQVDAAAQQAQCQELGVTPKPELRGNWSGMHTDRGDCFGYVDFGRGDNKQTYTPDSGQEKATGCLELWDSDMGHEAVHKQLCLERQRDPELRKQPKTLGSLIEEDISAYRYSMQAAVKALNTMQIRCSTDKNSAAFRARAKQLLQHVQQFKLQQGAQP